MTKEIDFRPTAHRKKRGEKEDLSVLFLFFFYCVHRSHHSRGALRHYNNIILTLYYYFKKIERRNKAPVCKKKRRRRIHQNDNGELIQKMKWRLTSARCCVYGRDITINKREAPKTLSVNHPNLKAVITSLKYPHTSFCVLFFFFSSLWAPVIAADGRTQLLLVFSGPVLCEKGAPCQHGRCWTTTTTKRKKKKIP